MSSIIRMRKGRSIFWDIFKRLYGKKTAGVSKCWRPMKNLPLNLNNDLKTLNIRWFQNFPSKKVHQYVLIFNINMQIHEFTSFEPFDMFTKESESWAKIVYGNIWRFKRMFGKQRIVDFCQFCIASLEQFQPFKSFCDRCSGFKLLPP